MTEGRWGPEIALKKKKKEKTDVTEGARGLKRKYPFGRRKGFKSRATRNAVVDDGKAGTAPKTMASRVIRLHTRALERMDGRTYGAEGRP